MMFPRKFLLISILSFSALAGIACKHRASNGADSPDGGLIDNNGNPTTGTELNADGGAGSGPYTFVTGPNGNIIAAICGDHKCQCSDGIDNNGTGGTDMQDITCAGPQDDSEGSFGTGLPGDNMNPFQQDCFFDGDTGSGNDGCKIDTICSCPDTNNDGYHDPCVIGGKNIDHPLGAAQDCNPGKLNTPAGAAECVSYCGARAPNGCDGFGCCTVKISDTVTKNYILNASCDPLTGTGCTECIQNQETLNTCATCEYCIGKTTLPPECNATPVCTNGTNTVPVCSDTQPCTGGNICIYSCCQPPIIAL